MTLEISRDDMTIKVISTEEGVDLVAIKAHKTVDPETVLQFFLSTASTIMAIVAPDADTRDLTQDDLAKCLTSVAQGMMLSVDSLIDKFGVLNAEE